MLPGRSTLVPLLLLAALGCGERAPRERVIVLGLDGLDPGAVDLLMAEGKLPNLARMRQAGAYGRLASMPPLLSPVVWTTIATGKTPAEHGIGHFVAVNQATGRQLPVTSRMRRVKAIWNIVAGAGRRVGVVGWWATWPAEPVNGAVVSDHLCYHFLFTAGADPGSAADGLTHPPELLETIRPRVRRPGDVTLEEASRFVSVTPEELARPFDFDDDLSHFKWAYATAETYRAIGLDLWREQRPDLLLVYVEATDSTSHLFGHLFRAGPLSGEIEGQRRRFGGAVEEMYRYADEVVGEYLEAMDADTTLVVLSDHGFALGELHDDPSKTRDMRRVSERYHREEGILYLYGRGVKRNPALERPTVLDVTPTLLALLGIGAAADMPGRVLAEALDFAPPGRSRATYEEEAAMASPGEEDGEANPEILERLQSLGYLDASSPQGERNLAASLFQARRYDEAVDAYRRLIAEDPADGALQASLAGALGALGRYDEALAALDRAIELEPLNPEAYHNRALIYERQGKSDAAAGEYRQALRYDPRYQPARQALARLGAREQPEMGDRDRLAATIAERASDLARRGDYPGAMARLDEAERIAPELALVHHYRANVAYLMGERERAIAALERALVLEPDNALYRRNLERLRHEPAAPSPPR